MPEEDVYGKGLQPLFLSWLKSMGLNRDPFAVLDAGQDPDIPAYLVDHADFEKMWGDWPAFVFAPAGGGKTAFRARLARACRVGEDGRRIFPIVYRRLPAPDEITQDSHGQSVHLKNVLRQAAQELLFLSAYRALELNALDEGTLVALRRILDENLPSPLDDYLTRLHHFGDLSLLANEFDRTASHLINPPGPQDVNRFCERLAHIPASSSSEQSPEQRFEELVQFVLGPLRFEAIYLLVDGVDAYPETRRDSNAAISVMQWLLDNATEWAARRIFVKFFLPVELDQVLSRQFPSLLTPPVKIAIIQWTANDLVQVIRRRLGVASAGMFDSLDAISSPGLRGAEKTLARRARPPVPREALVLTERLLVEHVQQSQGRGKLEPEDLEAVEEWYRIDRLAVSSP